MQRHHRRSLAVNSLSKKGLKSLAEPPNWSSQMQTTEAGNALSRWRPTGARCDPDGARPALLSCREPSSVSSPRRTGPRRPLDHVGQEVWDSIVGSRGAARSPAAGSDTEMGPPEPAKTICEGARRSFRRWRPRERRSGVPSSSSRTTAAAPRGCTACHTTLVSASDRAVSSIACSAFSASSALVLIR